MEHLSNKEREIIRLAYTSKDPELRRKAVERVLQARYTPEFKAWADKQGDVFTHQTPSGPHKVKFNSLNSQEQKEVYRRWAAGEYHDQGGPAPGEKGEGEGEKKEAPAEGEEEERGHKYSDRTELRGQPKKKMDDKATLSEEDLAEILPVDKIRKQRHGDRILEGLQKASYGDLDALYESTKFLAANPEDDFSKNHWLRKHAGLSGDDLKTFFKGLSKKLEDAKGRLYSENVLEIANDNDLEGIDADSVRQFRIDKPATGRKLTPEQLKQKFLAGPWITDPKQRERIMKMSPDEFMAMRNSILEEEEEELEMAGASKQAADELRLFERPPGSEGSEKAARLTVVGRQIVRIAYESKDATTRDKIVKLLQQHMAPAGPA